eukprot:Gb_20144 [translate_table: standard]
MVLRSVRACIDSEDWLQSGMQDTGFKPPDELLSCSRPLMDRRLKPNTELALKCPRCESTNTKFCYYNNYSLTQPRYFCKSCRRYWTKGGSLRNVPVGGGCRKNKRSKRTADQPSTCIQNEPSTSTSGGNNNELTAASPNLDQSSLPSAPASQVYFGLLNEGDALGITYSRLHHHHHHQPVGMADQTGLPGNCNSCGIMEIPAARSSSMSAATLQSSLPPLVNLSNLSTLQSLKSTGLITGRLEPPQGCSRTEQGALMNINGDLSSIFEAHQQQQMTTSSSSATINTHVSNDGFNETTFNLAVHDHRLNCINNENRLNCIDNTSNNDVQWQLQQQKVVIPLEDDNGQVLLPFDPNNAVQELAHGQKLKQLVMNGIPPISGKVYEENRPTPIYNNNNNWQVQIPEGFLETSGSNMGAYWNGGAWPDLSSYGPYSNPLI